MGKSGGRRKKAGDSNRSPVKNSSNAVMEPDSSTSTPLKRSHAFKLREEGNTSFHAGNNALRISRSGPKKPEPVLPPEPKPKPKPKPKSNPSNENQKQQVATIVCRPLKLVYDHDIRLAEMPTNCSFRVLRETVRKRFPTTNSVLIKYKDNDGDLVTITSTNELRLAESSVDKNDSLGMLKLFIVEVSPFEEPPIFEEQEQEKENEKEKHIDRGECVLTLTDKVEKQNKDVSECKEVEMDDWLFEFAKLFRSHICIESIDAHVDLHEIGMEFCSDALEEVVTSEEAQGLFDKAALKFQEVAALAFFNWGNVHMCAARKRDEKEGIGMGKEEYDWVKEKYYLAREKYEQALVIKPDLYEGFLALGQQQFELAKLHWSFGLAEKIDLSKETLELFNGAEEKMKAATDMWEKVEAKRASGSKKEEKLVDQGTVMGTQIHLFMGNMLFERSQVECKLGIGDWKRNLSAAVSRFKLAGASEVDISTIMKKHCSNENAKEGEAKGSRIHK